MSVADSVQVDLEIDKKKNRVHSHSDPLPSLMTQFPRSRTGTTASTISSSSSSSSVSSSLFSPSKTATRLPWERSASWHSSPPTTTSSSASLVDPFNLFSFFPTEPSQVCCEEGGKEWVWLSEESNVGNEERHYTEAEYQYQFDAKVMEGPITDVAGQVIDEEDKFGMLGLTSGKLARAVIKDIGSLLGRLPGFGAMAMNNIRAMDYDAPEDIEEVCWRYRERRAREEKKQRQEQ